MTTGNNGKSENLKPFQKGQSGNPSGRPKGIAPAVRKAFKDSPVELVEVLRQIANDVAAKDSDRIAAARELLDRGWGKSPAFAPMEDGDPLELGDVPRQIASVMDELAARRSGKAAGGSEAGAVDANGTAGTDRT